MKRNNKFGFTLVELLAVIVILAIILVIAVPKVMDIINDAKKGTLESTVKMIASAAEKQKVQNTVLGKEEKITCESVVKLNDVDYESCSITFEDDTAKVTIVGSGKFEGLNVCSGTKTSSTATDDECNNICVSEHKIKSYKAKDFDSCKNYLKPIVVDDWENSEEDLEMICEGGTVYYTIKDYISELMEFYGYTKEQLISNNVVSEIETNDSGEILNVSIGNQTSCVSYTKEVFVDDWGDSEEDLEKLCNGDGISGSSLEDYVYILIREGHFTEDELIYNNVINVEVSKICIKKETPSSCFEIENGTIISYDKSCGENVVISEKIDGEIIKEIGEEAFYDADIKSVTLPSTITKIGDSSFENNNIIELNLSELEELTEIGFAAFRRNFLSNIKFPTTITTIADDAFSSNQISGELDLSGYVDLTSVDGFGSNQITSVKLPTSITTLGGFEGNKISGELDLSDLKKLTEVGGFYGNQITNIKLPISVTTIGDSAFRDNQIIGELDLSKYSNLATIDAGAFEDNQITSVKLPTSIVTIDAGAFYKTVDSNPNLTTIINPTGKSFNWGWIINRYNNYSGFETGEINGITISAS